MVAVRGGRESRPEKLCPAGVPAQHAVDLGVRHRHLRSGFGVRARPYRPVDRQAFVDPADALLGAVVCGAHQVDLTEQGEDLQKKIVALAILDLLPEADQQLLRRHLIGREDELTRSVELASLMLMCAILGSGGRTTHARRPAGADYLQLTVTVNGFVTMPAIGFLMSAPVASPVMV